MILALCLGCAKAQALTVDQIEPKQTYHISGISISGNHALSTSEIEAQLSTKTRPAYLPWKKRPIFDPDVFVNDIQRIKRRYKAHGYFEAAVTYDLNPKDSRVNIHLGIKENAPIKVQQVNVLVDHYTIRSGTPLYNLISIKPGEIFDEGKYQAGENAITEFFQNGGYARVSVTRRADVNLDEHAMRIWYFSRPGVRTVFGTTKLTGTEEVRPNIVLRELSYKPGDPFSQAKIEDSRKKILALNLFSVVHFELLNDKTTREVVPILLNVKEKPKHEVIVGGGYNTESQFIADFEWNDYDWIGGGRQLSLLLRYSNIDSVAALILKQPYFLGSPNLTGFLSLREDIQQVPPYTLFGTRLIPRVEYRIADHFTLYGSYHLEYDQLNSLSSTLVRALGGIKENGILSGPNAGIVLDTSNDPYNPTAGYVLNLDALQGGGIFGGSYDFWRVVGEAKKYQEVAFGTILALRLKLGVADSIGSKRNYPLFYRFYAGGAGSVRGYAYWMLGPLTADDVPLGGLGWIEGSIELRHRIWDKLSGAVFLDFGQLSTTASHIPIDNLQFAAGPAISYSTPLGPIRLDLGIPFNPPHGQQPWQIYFSIGQYF